MLAGSKKDSAHCPTPAEKSKMREKQYFHMLDVFRSIAAFLVVFEHARNYLLVDYSNAKNPGPIWQAVYFFSQLGHEAVLIFFVLSGCVIAAVLHRDMIRGKWSWSQYFFNRLTRLWIVLIPALLLTAVLDTAAINLTEPLNFIHAGGFAHIQSQPLIERSSPTIFFGNLFFLQTIIVPPFGSDTPLWSLAYEFWYYIVFPIVYIAIFTKASLRKRALLLALAVTILCFVGASISKYFIIWLLGAICFFIHSKTPPKKQYALPGLVAFAFLTAVSISLERFGTLDRIIPPFFSNLVIGLSCAGMVYFSMSCSPPPIMSSIAAFFSGFSYTLYLIHLPVLTLIICTFIPNNESRFMPTFHSAVFLLALMGASYLFSFAFYLVTEKHTFRIRAILSKIFSGQKRLSAPVSPQN